MFFKRKKEKTNSSEELQITLPNSMVKHYYKTLLKDNYILFYRRPFSEDFFSLSYDNALELNKIIIKELKEKNILRKIQMDYTGFSGADEKVDYLLNKYELDEFGTVENIIFEKKITKIDDIKTFLNYANYEYDFIKIIYLNNDMLLKLSVFETDILALNVEDKGFLEEFYEVFEETENGFLKDNQPAVGHDTVEFICNKDVVYYNLSLVYAFQKKFIEYLLLADNDAIVKNIICGIKDINFFPIMLKNEELLIKAIAFNKFLTSELTRENEVGNFFTINLVLGALKLNPKCYYNLDEYYKKDSYISSVALDLDISLLPEIIKCNNLDENKIKTKIKEFI